MLSTDEMDHLLAGSFRVDCPIMTWREGGQVISGAGYFIQRAESGFEFSLLSSEPGTANGFLEGLKRDSLVPAGQLLPVDAGGEIEAKDVNGETWLAVGLDPDHLSSEYQAVSGHARELRTRAKEPSATGAHLQILIRGTISFPRNVHAVTKTFFDGEEVGFSTGPSAARTRTQQGSASLQEIAGGAKLDLESTDPLRPGTAERAIDALSFLEARPVPWCAITRLESGRLDYRLRGDRYTSLAMSRLPPVPTRSPKDATNYWSLFSRILERPEGAREPDELGLWIGVVASASNWPLEARFLLTAIAIEGLSHVLLPGFRPELAGYTKDDVDRATTEILDGDLPDRLRERLVGVLRQSRATAADRLHQLSRSGVISEEEVKAWKALRNLATHGSFPAISQDLVTNAHRLRTLFCKLVFNLVGFSGDYIDYGSLRWPTRRYPSDRESGAG